MFFINIGKPEEIKAITAVLDKIGKSRKVPLTQIALAYVLAKQPYIFPIVGLRKLEHLQDSIDALKLRLTKEEVKEIEEACDFNIGFPHDFIGTQSSQNVLLQWVGNYDWVDAPKSLNAS